MPVIATDDPWWREDTHRAAYVQQGLLGPTLPTFWTFNPAYAQLQLRVSPRSCNGGSSCRTRAS